MKELYTFTVSIQKEVLEKIEEIRKNESGEEEKVEVTKTVKKDVPIDILIKKPSRRQLEEADEEFSIYMSECVKKGILTKNMLMKKYADTGGALAEKEAKELISLYKEAGEIEQKVVRNSIKKENDEDLSSYDERMAEIKRRIIDIESDYRILFSHTADVKAQNRILLWYVLYLTYYKGIGIDIPEYRPFFKGETFHEKIENYYKLDEEEDELFLKISHKIGAIVSYWYFSGSAFSKEDVDSMFEDSEQQKE